jgi:hypothetical protein
MLITAYPEADESSSHTRRISYISILILSLLCAFVFQVTSSFRVLNSILRAFIIYRMRATCHVRLSLAIHGSALSKRKKYIL